MIDSNGKFTRLSIDDARTIVLQKAALAGVTVLEGSVEDQIKEWLAQSLVDFDTSQYMAYVKQFNPTGSDIDLQNPGFPRLGASPAEGFLEINNVGGTENLTIPVNTVFTAPNGIEYENPNDALTVAIGETKTLFIQSIETGPKTNLPAAQTFTGLSSGVVTNPQPLVGGRDVESDTEYLDRLTEERQNHVGQQTSVSVVEALQETYEGARIYVNNAIASEATPIPVPANGYNLVVLFPSGVNASAAETQKALDVIKGKLEFVNVNAVEDVKHPVIKGVIFSGVFSQNYSITVARSVKTTINSVLEVSFAPGISAAEKVSLVQTLVQNFIQRVMNTLGGAGGSMTCSFVPLVGLSVPLTLEILPFQPSKIEIAPYISIEDIRSLTIDAGDILKNKSIQLKKVDTLTVELDPEEAGETAKTLSIDAPTGGTLSFVDFASDSLYTDNTSWYDRFIFLNPSLITVTVNEVA